MSAYLNIHIRGIIQDKFINAIFIFDKRYLQ